MEQPTAAQLQKAFDRMQRELELSRAKYLRNREQRLDYAAKRYARLKLEKQQIKEHVAESGLT